ncbi:MAG: hypothetical protein GF344_17585, partial [Chitinivibrionales bacterium]|nr:hypothetical protein [Chitinivibrionales bacterium]MBD3358479.1 hypothetical protein [Chitinivibrionales bacterium]
MSDKNARGIDLWKLFARGNRGRIARIMALFLVKHSPVLVLPLYIGELVDTIDRPE